FLSPHSCYCSRHPRVLPSFPTRRSSDLLPMLKGRSREEYASLKQISPWEVQMVSTAASKENEKDRHIFDFPVEIQEQIYLAGELDRKSTRLNSSHVSISYAVFCLKKKSR